VKTFDFNEDVPVPMRKRKQRRCNISQNEKLDIIHEVLVQHQNVNIVAKRYRISYSAVKSLISKAKKNPEIIAEIFSKPTIKSLKFEIISKVVNELISKDSFIDSCDFVLEKIYESDDRAKMLMKNNRRKRFLVNSTDVNKVMRQMGLKYRKVKHIANSANSTTGKIVR
jgi:hypothetical protein